MHLALPHRSSETIHLKDSLIVTIIDRSYIGGVERGEHNVAVINLLKIADALEMKLSDLLIGCEL